MSGKQLVYQAYLLRLWRDHAGAAWRATLIDAARPEERRHFASMDELLAFLLAQTDPATLLTQSDRDQCTPDGAE